MDVTWQRCSSFLRDEMPPQQFNTWIRPLRAEESAGALQLTAPNRFVKEWVRDKYFDRIRQLVAEVSGGRIAEVQLETPRSDTLQRAPLAVETTPREPRHSRPMVPVGRRTDTDNGPKHNNFLMENHTFQSFVEGKSNQLARAAAQQVAQNPGGSYNPLFIYGGVGLGKTHLMHAVGNALARQQAKRAGGISALRAFCCRYGQGPATECDQ